MSVEDDTDDDSPESSESGPTPPEPASAPSAPGASRVRDSQGRLIKDPRILQFCDAGHRRGILQKDLAALVVAQFHISERQAQRYVREVKLKLQTESEERSPQQIEAMLMAAARAATRAGNHAAAISALDKVQRRKRLTPRSRRALKDYAAVGEPPMTDPLAGVEWMQRIMLISARDVATDPELAPSERREELRRLARCVAALVPQERVFDAEQRIRRDAGIMDDVQRDPEVENVEPSNQPAKSLRVKKTRG